MLTGANPTAERRSRTDRRHQGEVRISAKIPEPDRASPEIDPDRRPACDVSRDRAIDSSIRSPSHEPRQDPAASSLIVESLATLARLLARQAAREHLLNNSESSGERREAIDQY